MKITEHGGNLFHLAQWAPCPAEEIIDFSVNLRPEGTPPFLQQALMKAMHNTHAYPSPHAEEACLAAAAHYKHSADCFVFGNGSNELIHALTRLCAQQGHTCAHIIEPAFSEYALACTLAGLKVVSLWGGIGVQSKDILHKALHQIPPNGLIFLANPANPSGTFYAKQDMLDLLTMRPDLLWIIDEAFIEYAGKEEDVSLLSLLADNVIILRSLTKFHAMAGVRVGFLLTSASRAQSIRALLPSWTVNVFALQAALAVFADTSPYTEQTRQENIARREDLYTRLQCIEAIELFPSVANYILFRHKKAPHNLAYLLLKTYGIAIRDCSNYYGLEDGTWYRVAVRFAHEHEKLCSALQNLIHNENTPR